MAVLALFKKWLNGREDDSRIKKLQQFVHLYWIEIIILESEAFEPLNELLFEIVRRLRHVMQTHIQNAADAQLRDTIRLDQELQTPAFHHIGI